MKKYIFLKIIGKVQGVAFRYYSKLKADELGLLGSTENKIDGSVESYALGEEKDVDEFIKWCKNGSPASSVEKVEVTSLNLPENQEYSQFSILR